MERKKLDHTNPLTIDEATNKILSEVPFINLRYAMDYCFSQQDFSMVQDLIYDIADLYKESHVKALKEEIEQIERELSKSKTDTSAYRNLYREAIKEIEHENYICKELQKEITSLKEQLEEAKKTESVNFVEWIKKESDFFNIRRIADLWIHGDSLIKISTIQLYQKFKQQTSLLK